MQSRQLRHHVAASKAAAAQVAFCGRDTEGEEERRNGQRGKGKGDRGSGTALCCWEKSFLSFACFTEGSLKDWVAGLRFDTVGGLPTVADGQPTPGGWELTAAGHALRDGSDGFSFSGKVRDSCRRLIDCEQPPMLQRQPIFNG